jgi:hypothetical protein
MEGTREPALMVPTVCRLTLGAMCAFCRQESQPRVQVTCGSHSSPSQLCWIPKHVLPLPRPWYEIQSCVCYMILTYWGDNIEDLFWGRGDSFPIFFFSGGLTIWPMLASNLLGWPQTCDSPALLLSAGIKGMHTWFEDHSLEIVFCESYLSCQPFYWVPDWEPARTPR